MSAAAPLRAYVRGMRAAQLLRYAAYALGPVIALAYALTHYAVLMPAQAVIAALVAGVAIVAGTDLWRGRQRVTLPRTLEHLDRQFPVLEDSVALLATAPETLSPLQQLQRERVASAFAALAASSQLAPQGYARLPRALASALLPAALLVNLMWLLPTLAPGSAQRAVALPTQIRQVLADIDPPPYTGLDATRLPRASLSLPESAALRLTVTLSGDADSLSVVTDAGRELKLYAAGDGRWQSVWWQPDAGTYRFVADGVAVPVAGEDLVHTIALLADGPPAVEIVAPVSRLHTVSSPDGALLPVSLRITDDFGIRAVAAQVTRSSGSGEQVSFERQTLTLFDESAATRRDLRLDERLDLMALGLAPGSELYVHFEARDARSAAANIAESQTLIVRWLEDDVVPDIVLDNQVVQVMPEYFRSQRQIIIDSEALLAGRETLSETQFAGRAQSLALDQKALRLRYGQFMGEEDGGEPVASAAESSDGEEHYPGDGHDHADSDFVAASQPRASEFGDVQAAIEPYAHMHDQAEQATLFDPETHGLLRRALTAMWRSEGELRQYRPSQSLPHQYEALALIKRVQNRSRVYVARVGFEPTPVDPMRRLTGTLDEIPASAALAARDEANDQAALVAAMLSLLDAEVVDADPAALVADWLAQRRGVARRAGDDTLMAATLDAEAALGQWRIAVDCAGCRERLAAYWRRYAPSQLAPAARARRPFDAFAETEGPP